jgi:hypothetical protein
MSQGVFLPFSRQVAKATRDKVSISKVLQPELFTLLLGDEAASIMGEIDKQAELARSHVCGHVFKPHEPNYRCRGRECRYQL